MLQCSCSECPFTPPPSPEERSRRSSVADAADADMLVHIKVLLVDRKCPEFNTTHNKVRVRRFVECTWRTLVFWHGVNFACQTELFTLNDHTSFNCRHLQTHRFVDVDFNSLDTTINLQTWVVILDFLGMGAKVHDLDDYSAHAHMTRSPSKMVDLVTSTDGKPQHFPAKLCT